MGKPLAAAVLDQAEAVRLLPAATPRGEPVARRRGTAGTSAAAPPAPAAIPAYAYPEERRAGARPRRALQRLARAGSDGQVPELAGLRTDGRPGS